MFAYQHFFLLLSLGRIYSWRSNQVLEHPLPKFQPRTLQSRRQRRNMWRRWPRCIPLPRRKAILSHSSHQLNLFIIRVFPLYFSLSLFKSCKALFELQITQDVLQVPQNRERIGWHQQHRRGFEVEFSSAYKPQHNQGFEEHWEKLPYSIEELAVGWKGK